MGNDEWGETARETTQRHRRPARLTEQIDEGARTFRRLGGWIAAAGVFVALGWSAGLRLAQLESRLHTLELQSGWLSAQLKVMAQHSGAPVLEQPDAGELELAAKH